MIMIVVSNDANYQGTKLHDECITRIYSLRTGYLNLNLNLNLHLIR